MGKKRSISSGIKNARRIRQGRGKGRGRNYKPWITIQDISSRGLSTRIKGMKTGRIHHLLSRLELQCFYMLDWSGDVVDIREQYPLQCSKTRSIAESLKITHPRVDISKVKRRTAAEKLLGKKIIYEDTVMTTDFLVTVRKEPFGTQEIALTVKYSKDLMNKRTIAKFEIERVYWETYGVEWKIFTELNVDPVLVRNIEWVHSFHTPDWLLEGMEELILEAVEEFLFARLQAGSAALRNATNDSDRFFEFNSGVSMMVVRHLIGSRSWKVDMSSPD